MTQHKGACHMIRFVLKSVV